MLKTNSKKARENVRAYILDTFNDEGYNFTGRADSFADVARFIYDVFTVEKLRFNNERFPSEFDAFADWCSGLPLVIDCDFYVHPAIPLAARIMEETEAEEARFTDPQAEQFLTLMIYNEIKRAI